MYKILLSIFDTHKDPSSLFGFVTYLTECHDDLCYDSEVIIRGSHKDLGAICEVTCAIIYDDYGDCDDYAADDFWECERHTCDGFFDSDIGYYVPFEKLRIPDDGKLLGEIILQRPTIQAGLGLMQFVTGHKRISTMNAREVFNRGCLFT